MILVSYLLLIFFMISCGDSGNNSTPAIEQETSLDLQVLMDRNDVIWGFDFLDDGRILFTERSGRMGIFNPENESVSPVSGVPPVVVQGEGGLLDVRVRGNNAHFCFNRATANGTTIAMGRARLQGNQLTDLIILFESNDPQNSRLHFGCRIEFNSRGQIFLSLGERGNRRAAQDPLSHLGKIIVLNADGSGARVFSSGHRNVQGLAINPATGELWATELGPRGGDELNIIREGGNYGWPLISHGEDAGGDIEASSRPGFVDPLAFWVPSISPSGLAFWRGHAFIANLSGEHIRKLVLNGNQVSEQEVLFENLGWRFRNLRVGPDNILYFSTDEGRFGKVLPQ